MRISWFQSLEIHNWEAQSACPRSQPGTVRSAERRRPRKPVISCGCCASDTAVPQVPTSTSSAPSAASSPATSNAAGTPDAPGPASPDAAGASNAAGTPNAPGPASPDAASAANARRPTDAPSTANSRCPANARRSAGATSPTCVRGLHHNPPVRSPRRTAIPVAVPALARARRAASRRHGRHLDHHQPRRPTGPRARSCQTVGPPRAASPTSRRRTTRHAANGRRTVRAPADRESR